MTGIRATVVMPHQATLEYSKPIVQQAVFAFWRRTVGIGFLVVLVAGVACVAVLLMLGETSWIVGALGTVFAITVALFVTLFMAHLRNATRKLHRLGASDVVFLAEEPSFTITSSVASSTLAWTVVVEVWTFPTFWILFFSKAHFFTLPLAGISPEMQAFVLRRIRASGGKIDG